MADVTVDTLKERIVAFAEGYAASTGLDLTVSTTRDTADAITVSIDGPDAPRVVGKGARVLDALQLVATTACIHRGDPRLNVLFDSEGYRARREQLLIETANDLAAQVEEAGQEAVLDPLSALERKIVHNALLDHPGVMTYSEGMEPNRYIVIAPRPAQ
jgi:spoIIIJ-associated protein